MRSVVILGSTGSIGTQTLEVIGTRRGEFMVDGLSANGSNPRLLAEQVLEFAPLKVAIADEYAVRGFRNEIEDLMLDRGLVDWELPEFEVISGPHAASELAGMQADVVVNAITGAAGLLPTLAVLKAGTTLSLIHI